MRTLVPRRSVGHRIMVIGLFLWVGSAIASDVRRAEEHSVEDLPPAARWLLTETHPAPNVDAGAIARGAVDWAALIDATWGPSPWSAADRARIFDDYWDEIDQENACFQDLDTDWDALRTLYRDEAVAPTISAGRFTAIMTQMARALQEGHSGMYDSYVLATSPTPGVPLFVRAMWGFVCRTGATVTPLEDGSGLVYQVIPSHPLGLEPGDRILGYDGRPWLDLAHELIDVHQLPMNGPPLGASEEAAEHILQGCVGSNWQLFTTIDILKRSTGEIQHLSTAPLSSIATCLWADEQIPIPGVPKPDINTSDWVAWGILPGTNIGYINVLGWANGASVSEDFEQAMQDLTQTTVTDGLIVDFRLNLGGNMFLSDPGLEILFDTTVQTIDWVVRCGSPHNHLSLCEQNISSNYDIVGNPSTNYTNPIAVLNGPGALSSGDQVALRLTFHPEAMTFGKSTSTTFNSLGQVQFTGAPNGSWSAGYCAADAYLVSNPGEYLTHDKQPIDCNVWLEPDDVAQGIDTVLQTAIDWIEGTQPDTDGDTVADPCDNCAADANAAQIDSDLDGAGDVCDCAPGDPTIHPGAVERADGVDNQCAGDLGFGLIDETGSHSGFLNAANRDEYLWIGQTGATAYEVARSTVPDFSSDCILFATQGTALVDAAVPPPGGLFFYLNRSASPVGSWGQDSDGIERTFSCS